jgi:hypothetical protein
MVKINKIAPPTLQIYTPNGELLGTVNGERINIDRNGELEKYPNGLLDTMTRYYLELT